MMFRILHGLSIQSKHICMICIDLTLKALWWIPCNLRWIQVNVYVAFFILIDLRGFKMEFFNKKKLFKKIVKIWRQQHPPTLSTLSISSLNPISYGRSYIRRSYGGGGKNPPPTLTVELKELESCFFSWKFLQSCTFQKYIDIGLCQQNFWWFSHF